MRFFLLPVLACLSACSPGASPPAKTPEAAIDCLLEHALYTERQNGYELRFRPSKPWESVGMVEAVFDLRTPKGEEAWGYISSNMGTARDTGSLFLGCARPGPDDGSMTEEQINACRIWTNVVYALGADGPAMLSGDQGDAPRSLLLSDLGRKVRYSDLVMNPGDEPWDVFDFKTCAS